MRKLSLFIMSMAVLGAFMGLNAVSASANHVFDPACAAPGHPVQVIEFSISTNPMVQLVPGPVTARGIACGTRLHQRGPAQRCDAGSGVPTQYKRADISTPPGVTIAATRDGIADGSYMGNAQVGVASFIDSFCLIAPQWLFPTEATIRVQNNGPDCPARGSGRVQVITCTRGDSGLLGWANIWVTRDDQGTTDPDDDSYVLTIGEFHGLLGGPAGLTRLYPYLQCANFGPPATNACGSAEDPVVATNGFAAANESCGSGQFGENGVYKVTATRRDNQTTPPKTACVPWTECGPNWCPPARLRLPGAKPPYRPPGPPLRPVSSQTQVEEAEAEESEAEE